MTATADRTQLPADWRDFFALTKPRVMSLVVFTGLCGLLAAPGTIHPVLGFTAMLCIALGAGAAGALNQWYEADLDAQDEAHRGAPAARRADGPPDARAFRHRSVGRFSVLLMGLAVNWLAAAILAVSILFYVGGLHDLAQAAHAAEHRHRRRGRRVPAADRLGRGDRRRRRCCRCCCSRSSSCGRRRISGRSRCS